MMSKLVLFFARGVYMMILFVTVWKCEHHANVIVGYLASPTFLDAKLHILHEWEKITSKNNQKILFLRTCITQNSQISKIFILEIQ